MSFNFFDVSVLNPLTWPRRVINNTIAAVSDQNKGIWLGKKPLKDSLIGLTLSPGFDLFHWALMIDGRLYEVVVDKKYGKFRDTQDKDYIDKFKWIRLREGSGRSHSDLIEECERIVKPYSLLPLDDSGNCQMFVCELFQYAANISTSVAAKEIIFQSGTALF